MISTAGNPNFDYNVVTTYTLTVTVEDKYGLTDTGTLTVCVGGQAPRGPRFTVVGPDMITVDEEQVRQLNIMLHIYMYIITWNQLLFIYHDVCICV